MRLIAGRIAVVLLTLAFILFFTRYKKGDKTYRIFTIYLGIISLCELTCWISVLFIKNNIIVTHIDCIAQFVLLSLFFASMYDNKKQRKIVFFITPTLSMYLIFRFIVHPDLLFKYDDVMTFSTSMVLIIYSVVHLYNLLNQEKKFYYTTIGLIIYLVGSTTIVLTGNILIALDNMELYNKIWIINNFLYLTYQIFVIYDWYKNYYTQKNGL